MWLRSDFIPRALLVLAWAAPAAGAQGSSLGPLYPLRTPEPGWQPLAVGEMTGDGLDDMVAAAYVNYEWRLGVFESRGDTTFAGHVEAALVGLIANLATPDMDGDGDRDVVVIERSSTQLIEQIRTFLVTSSGDLVPTAPLVLDSQAEGSDFGDMNLDGFVDAVTGGDFGSPYTGTLNPDGVAVLLSDGQGAFSLHHTQLGANWTDDIALLDLDDDGDLDVVNSNDFPLPLAEVSLFANRGAGKLEAPTVQTLANHDGLRTGDFDEDGRVDLLLEGWDGFQVAFADGSGALGPSGPLVPAKWGIRAPCDLDGDGHLDLVTAGEPSGALRHYGRGDGTFEAPLLLDAPFTGALVFPGEVNGDGLLDWIQAVTSQRALVLPAVAARDYELAPRTALQGADGLLVEDFDGDGAIDLADFDSATRRLAMRPGLGDGHFAAPTITPLGVGGYLFEALDVENDGDVDLIGTTTGGAAALIVGRNDGVGAFPAVEITAVGGDMHTGAPGDFDADGDVDLALLLRGSHGLVVYHGAGDGTFFFSAVESQGKGSHAVLAQDFDRDGVLDLVTSDDISGAIGIYVLLGKGDGTFRQPNSLSQSDVNGHKRLVAADFALDGYPDVTDGWEFFPNTAAGFQPEVDLDQIVDGDKAAPDVDGDGAPDLVGAGVGYTGGGGGPVVARGLGDGTFEGVFGFAPFPGAPLQLTKGRALFAADVNGDLRPDLVVRETQYAAGDADAWVLLNGMQPPAIASVGGLFAAQAGTATIQGSGIDAGTEVFVGGALAPLAGVSPGVLEIQLDGADPGAYDVEVTTSLGSTLLAGALERWPVLDAGDPVAGAQLDVELDNHAGGVYALVYSLSTFGSPIPLGPELWYGLWLAAPVVAAAGIVDPASGELHLAFPMPPAGAGLTFHLQALAQQAGVGVVPELALTNLVTRTIAAP